MRSNHFLVLSILLLSLLGMALSLPGQALIYDWHWVTNSPTSGAIDAIAPDGNGGLYVTGNFYSTVDCDPGPGTQTLNSSAAMDAFMVHLDANHNLLWVRQWSGTANDMLPQLSSDASGNVYCGGNVLGTLDIDPGPGTITADPQAGQSAYFLKLDPAGNLLWSVVLQSPASTGRIYTHAVDPVNGDIVLFGEFAGTSDFDPGPGTFNLSSPSPSTREAFVWKLNSQGQFLWVKQLDEDNLDPVSVAFNSQHQILLSGKSFGDVDLDPGAGQAILSPQSGTDAWLALWDSGGNLVWTKSLANNGNAFFYGAKFGASDSIYCSIRYNEAPLDIDPGAGVFNANNPGGVALVKLDPAGNFVWGLDTEWPTNASGQPGWAVYNDHPYLCAQFLNAVDFDPGPGTQTITPQGGTDCYILRVSPRGQFEYVTHFEATSQAMASPTDLVSAGNGTFYMGGVFHFSVDMDPGPATLHETTQVFNGMIIQLHDSSLAVGGLPTPLGGAMLFPNPSSGNFNLRLPQAIIDLNVRITDMAGRTLWQEYHASARELSLEPRLPKGIYLLSVSSSDDLYTWRIAVQ